MTLLVPLSLRVLNTPIIPPSTYELWNSADKHANITLTNNDRTSAISAAAAMWLCVRSLSPKNSGKWYVEALQLGIGTSGGSNGPVLGLCTSSMTLTSAVGLVANSVGIQGFSSAGAARLFSNGAVSSSVAQAPAGSTPGIAVDFDTGRAWLRADEGDPFIGGGDPTAGTLPSYTFTPGSTLYVACSFYETGQTFELPTVIGDITGTVPSGFSIWTQ